jgi:diphthamide synthase (EF-2-diphthine--ammonia ligase)
VRQRDLRSRLRRRIGAGTRALAGLETIAFGDLFLADVRAWREALCARLGWRIETPLFGADTRALAQDMIAGGLRAHLVLRRHDARVQAISGREFDAALLADLPRRSIHAVNAANSIPACTPDRCSRTRCSLHSGERVLREGRFAYTDLELAV